jgi:hypothetical protein
VISTLALVGLLLHQAPVHTHAPLVPHVAVRLFGSCNSGFYDLASGQELASVGVANTGNVEVGLGTRVTFPDVIDDGTLSVNGIAEYAIYAPGNEKGWTAQFSHIHLTVRYRGNELATDPDTGETYPVIEQQDYDVVCELSKR